MKFLCAIVCLSALTLCSARELYVTNNWNDAKIPELYYAADNSKPIAHKTNVFFRHDGKTLFIRAEMFVRKGYPFPAITNKKGKWPSGESIEIFIDPGADGKGYYQIAVGANGDRFDNRYRKGPWKADWRSLVTHKADKWIAEIAIPLKGPKGTCTGFNFCRNVKIDGDYYSTWAKVGANFHRPGRFGKLYLGKRAEVDRIVRKAEYALAEKLKVRVRKLGMTKEYPLLFANKFNMRTLRAIGQELEVVEAMKAAGTK